METVLGKLAASCTARPRMVVLLAALLTIPALWIASTLTISTSRTALVSEEDPHWKRYMAFARAFGIPEDLVVVVESDDAAAVRAFEDAAAARLAGKEGVASIFHRVDLGAFERFAPLYADVKALAAVRAVVSSTAAGRLWAGSDPGARIEALSELLGEAPGAFSARPSGAETEALAQVLESLFGALARSARGEATGALELLDKGAIARAALEQEAQGGVDAFGYLTVNEGRTGVMFVRPTYTRDELEVVLPFVKGVREACEATRADFPGVQFGLTGIPASEVDELVTITKDTRLTTTIALIGVVALFLLYFRSLQLLLLSLVPILFGVIWTAAVIRLAFGYVNLMSSIFLVILIGMGVDFSVHIGSRFLEQRDAGDDSRTAARIALTKAGRGVVTGAITSAGAFLAVGWSGFKGIEELGFAAAIGLVLTLCASLTVFPALLVLRGHRLPVIRPRRLGLGHAVQAVLRARGWVVAASVAITLWLGWRAFLVPFDFSLLELLPKDAQSAVLMARMADDRELSANSAAITVTSMEEARRVTVALESKASVFRVVSAASMLPPDQAARHGELVAIVSSAHAARARALAQDRTVPLEAALQRLEARLENLSELAFRGGASAAVNRLEEALESVSQAREVAATPAGAEGVRRFTEALGGELEALLKRIEETAARGEMRASDLPDSLRTRFASADGRFAVYAIPKESIWDREALSRFVADVRSVDPEATGFPVTFYENSDLIRQGFLRAALYAAIAVLLLLAIDLRRLRDVFLAAIPVAMGAVWMIGAMEVSGLSYNLANVLGLPLIIGVGLDNGVHLLHRFRESGSVEQSAVGTGGAVMLSSLTTMVGFGSLAFASHRGYATLGEILFLGVGSCLVTALAVLPAILSWLPDRRVDGVRP